MISANLSAVFYLVSGILFILALRGLSSPDTSRQGKLFWYRRDDNCHSCNILINWKFFYIINLCNNFLSNWR